ncbi:unnamed protein product, partial [Nesidiocoris tenuis]
FPRDGDLRSAGVHRSHSARNRPRPAPVRRPIFGQRDLHDSRIRAAGLSAESHRGRLPGTGHPPDELAGRVLNLLRHPSSIRFDDCELPVTEGRPVESASL